MKVRDLIKELLNAPMDSEVDIHLKGEEDSWLPVGVDYPFSSDIEQGFYTTIRCD